MARNYEEPAGPRFSGSGDGSSSFVPRGDTLVVATFNIQNGKEVEKALRVIREHRDLGTADLLLLQEVDAEATRRIADALGLGWVYYPARERWGRGFGNAVLSRWPIVEDAKLILPHHSWFGASQRTATVTEIRIQGIPVRVYSTHLATPMNQSPGDRRGQFRSVLEDAAADSLVIIGGDLNSASIPHLALDHGFFWPTREGPRTTLFLQADHILFKGFGRISGSPETGTISENHGASDHRPVWARVLLPTRQSPGITERSDPGPPPDAKDHER